jgi:prolyl-tRNA synthetase
MGRQHEYIALGEQPITFMRVDPGQHADAVAKGRRQLPDPLDIAVAREHQPRAVANGEVEVKDRKTGARETMTIEAAINRFVA